jgi:hypothetical protein
MELCRLVTLDKATDGTIVPSVPYDRVSCDFELSATQAAIPISFQAAQNQLREQGHLKRTAR